MGQGYFRLAVGEYFDLFDDLVDQISVVDKVQFIRKGGVEGQPGVVRAAGFPEVLRPAG